MEIGQPWYLPWVQDGSLGVQMDIPTSVPPMVQNGLLGPGLMTGMVESGMLGKGIVPSVVQMAKGAYIPHEMAKTAYIPQDVAKSPYLSQEMAKGAYLPQEMAKGAYLPQEMGKGGYLPHEICSKAGLVSLPSVVSTQCPNVLPDQSFVGSMSQLEGVAGYSYPPHAPSKAVYNPYTQMYQVDTPKVATDVYGGKGHLYGYHQINTQQMIPLAGINMSLGQINPLQQILRPLPNIPPPSLITPGVLPSSIKDDLCKSTKRKLDDLDGKTDIKKAKMETKALKAKRPGFTDERYNETSYYNDHKTGLRKVYPYYFTFTTFTKGRWVGERILDVFAREFRAHPAEEYERCIKAGTLTVNYEKVDVDYRLKHNDLLANIVHRHEVPVSSEEIKMIHMDDDLVVVNKPASIPVHPCGRYRHNTVVFILAKEHGLKNLRTIHRLDRLTSGLLLFGRNPRKAREMEQQIRTRQVRKEYVCRVDGHFPEELIQCKEKIEVVSYKIGVCKVSPNGKDCWTDFQRLSYNGSTSVVVCRPHTGRMHQIRVHLQYLGFPVVNDPLYNHTVFGPEKGRGGKIGKTDEQLIQDLISIHNAENWLGLDDEGPSSSVPLFQAVNKKLSPTSSIPLNVSSLPGHDPMDTVQGRSESPDSAVDLASIPSSLDSPPGHFNLDLNVDVGVTCGIPPISMPPGTMPTTSMPLGTMPTTSMPPGTMPTTSMPPGTMPTTSMPPGTMPTTSMPPGTMPTTSMPPGTMPTTSMPHATTSATYTSSASSEDRTTTATQTGVEEADTSFDSSKLTVDRHCYECHVNYRDPRPKDLVMFLHAIKYCGSDWSFETELPHWARPDWREDQSTDMN